MNKNWSLIKATLSSDMSLFKINTKKKNKITKLLLPIILAVIVLVAVGSYAYAIMDKLAPLKLEYITISIFTLVTCLLTLIEGVYKSSSLLFECKDDNLLLALPIKKSTVLFVRIFKFYLFELFFNTLFLLPAIVLYPFYVSVGITYYIVSIIMILLLPIIPIVLSVIIGFFTSFISSKTKFKNFAQILISFIFIVGVFYLSSNVDTYIAKFAEHAQSINDIVIKICYPAGVYNDLILNFNIGKLLLFIGINIVLVIVTIKILSLIYFKINSESKSIKVKKSNHKVKISRSGVTKSFIKKEINRFINSPVYVINTIVGLILFLVMVLAIVLKFDGFAAELIKEDGDLTKDALIGYMPIVTLGLIMFGSFMSSITNSMISLEGKAFSILKTLPVKPTTILMSKVYTAIIIMLPFLLVGDIILFIYFKFNILYIILLLILSILLPLVSETIGIIVNLKYPKMNALNDTEVIKQSMSSFIAVLIGMILSAGSIALVVFLLSREVNNYLILGGTIVVYGIIFGLLYLYLMHKGTRDFNKITV